MSSSLRKPFSIRGVRLPLRKPLVHRTFLAHRDRNACRSRQVWLSYTTYDHETNYWNESRQRSSLRYRQPKLLPEATTVEYTQDRWISLTLRSPDSRTHGPRQSAMLTNIASCDSDGSDTAGRVHRFHWAEFYRNSVQFECSTIVCSTTGTNTLTDSLQCSDSTPLPSLQTLLGLILSLLRIFAQDVCNCLGD